MCVSYIYIYIYEEKFHSDINTRYWYIYRVSVHTETKRHVDIYLYMCIAL